MITLSKFITEYLSYCEYRKRLNFKTLKSYRIDLNQYLVFCDNSLDFLSKNTLDLYITELHKRYKPKSVKRKIASLKAFFHYLEYTVFRAESFRQIGCAFPRSQTPPQNHSFLFHPEVPVCTLWAEEFSSFCLSIEMLSTGYCHDRVVICYRNAYFRIMFPASVRYWSGE